MRRTENPSRERSGSISHSQGVSLRERENGEKRMPVILKANRAEGKNFLKGKGMAGKFEGGIFLVGKKNLSMDKGAGTWFHFAHNEHRS